MVIPFKLSGELPLSDNADSAGGQILFFVTFFSLLYKQGATNAESCVGGDALGDLKEEQSTEYPLAK